MNWNISKFMGILLIFFLSCHSSIEREVVNKGKRLIMVMDTTNNKEDYGFENEYGEMIVPFGKYSMLFDVNHGSLYFGISKTKGRGVVALDLNGKELFKVVTNEPYPMAPYEGLLMMEDENGLIGFANLAGEIVLSPRFTSVSVFNENGHAIFCASCKLGDHLKNNTEEQREKQLMESRLNPNTTVINLDRFVGMVNKRGDIVLGPIYNFIHSIGGQDSVFLVSKDQRLYSINILEQEVAHPPKLINQYDSIVWARLTNLYFVKN